MRPEDIDRAVRLGAVGSYQPTHATSDVSLAVSDRKFSLREYRLS
jgi:hypothetical protein